MTEAPILCLQSHYGAPGLLFDIASSTARTRHILQSDLRGEDLAHAAGLLTTMHLDQDGLLAMRAGLRTMLDRGGRWFFNGHVLRTFLPELGLYRPIVPQTLATLRLTPLAPHPVFDGVDRAGLAVRRGVRGFYGRGHNPPPPGADPVTGLGPELAPLDWDWARPAGGRIFSHAGNDLVSAPAERSTSERLARNILAWLCGDEGSV